VPGSCTVSWADSRRYRRINGEQLCRDYLERKFFALTHHKLHGADAAETIWRRRLDGGLARHAVDPRQPKLTVAQLRRLSWSPSYKIVNMPLPLSVWPGGVMVKALGCDSRGRGQLPAVLLSVNDLGQVVHTRASVTKQEGKRRSGVALGMRHKLK